jgi:hypothetical protein
VVVIRKEIPRCKTKRPTEDGGKVVAVTTLTNNFPVWYGGGEKPTLFGYSVPNNVYAVDHSLDVMTNDVRVEWTTNPDFKNPWHYMELKRPITEEQITALIVAMKLSC